MTPPIPPVFDGKFLRSKALLLLVPLVMAGCSTPAVRQQRLVAKPNMTFSDSAVVTYKVSGAASASYPIRSEGKATFADSPIAVDRLRIANERAMQDNIRQFLLALR